MRWSPISSPSNPKRNTAKAHREESMLSPYVENAYERLYEQTLRHYADARADAKMYKAGYRAMRNCAWLMGCVSFVEFIAILVLLGSK